MIAYIDDFLFLLILTLLAIPFLVFMRTPKSKAEAPVAPHVIE